LYKITKRSCTLEDFLKLKSYKPFKKYRTDSKPINFGTIFACTGATLGKQLRAAGFSEKDCDDTIVTFGLENVLNNALINKKPGLTDVDIKYTIVGSKFRELFFKSYPCLEERVKREQDFALRHGYVRTWTGPVRHLAELKYMKLNSQKNLIGMDKKLFSKMFAHLKNNAANSTIQTAEVYQAMPDITAIQRNLQDWNCKSWIWNYIHDSMELYVYKPEKELVFALLHEYAKVNRQPYYNLPQNIDVNVADLDNKDEYLAHGVDINIDKYNLAKELKKYNLKHGTEYEFVNYIPIYGTV
jgi:DNA polymerase I-like protein with 3'-5' exonuclease and polymerase domains